jgi:hypothetical protein
MWVVITSFIVIIAIKKYIINSQPFCFRKIKLQIVRRILLLYKVALVSTGKHFKFLHLLIEEKRCKNYLEHCLNSCNLIIS